MGKAIAVRISLAAGRNRFALKDKFHALRVLKGHKRSIIGLGQKMLRKIYASLSKKTHCVDKAVDYEALMVARNALRWIQMLVKHEFISRAASAAKGRPWRRWPSPRSGTCSSEVRV